MARKDIEESEVGRKIIQKTGYEPVDLLKAPVEPPKPGNLGGPDSNQILGVAIGAGLIIGGLVGWLILGGWLLPLFVVVGALRSGERRHQAPSVRSRILYCALNHRPLH